MAVTLWPAEAAGYRIQQAQVQLPGISVGTTTQPVVWAEDFGNATYAVLITVEGGALVVGLLSATLTPGSRTGTGCLVTVKNSGLVAIAAGSVLHVVGIG